MQTDKIKQQEIKTQKKERFNKLFNKLSDFDKNLILWIKEHKPTIHIIFKNVSRSGMLRRVETFIIKDNELYFINYLIEQMTTYKRDSEGLIKLYGCGMDMGFDLVYNFSSILFYNKDRGEYTLTNRNL